MGQFAYRCIQLSLANAFTAPTVIDGCNPGVNITSVLILSTGGGTGNIRFGGGGDAIPFANATGLSVIADPCSPINQGIFIDTPAAQPGITLTLFVCFSGQAASALGA